MEARNTTERGAAIVEMAIVAPFVLLLLLGIIEFGYLFGEFNEVRHAAREGARYAAVSNPDLDLDGNGTITADDVVLATCNAISLPTSIDITLTRSGDQIGDTATITVEADVSSLSNAPLISSFIPEDLSNTATFRLEQTATWTSDSGSC